MNPATGDTIAREPLSSDKDVGKDLSMYALEDYTEIKHVMVSLS